MARGVPDVGVFDSIAASRRLFERTIRGPFELDDRPCDTGVVQIDSLQLDEAETIAAAPPSSTHTFDSARVEPRRAAASRGARPRRVDAPPLGCAAAARAGIPSVVVSNFTWDWIYADTASFCVRRRSVIPTIQRAYRASAGGVAAADARRLRAFDGSCSPTRRTAHRRSLRRRGTRGTRARKRAQRLEPATRSAMLALVILRRLRRGGRRLRAARFSRRMARSADG